MLLATLSFFMGVVFCQQLPFLPPVLWWLLCLSSLAFLLLQRTCQMLQNWHFLTQLLLLFLFGLSWSAWRAEILLEQQLPAHLQQQSLQIQGEIISLPQTTNEGVRFEFLVKHLKFKQQTYPFKQRIRLRWYLQPEHTQPTLRPRQHWQFTVRLKRPHSSINPGSFDFETWLFQRRIFATGYVRQKPAPHLLQAAPRFSMEALRFAVQHAQQHHFSTHPHHGLLSALSVGVRSNLTNEHWHLFRATGTNHLMAISGLHVGMIGFLAFSLMHLLYRYIGRKHWLLYLPAWYPAVGFALCAATLYAFLAGLSLPTQRALLMLSIVIGSRLLHRNIPLTHSFALAVWGVLLFDPLAVLSSSFWLSFGAVFILLYAFSGQTPTVTWRELLDNFHQAPSLYNFNSFIWYWIKRLTTWLFSAQIVIFLGLAPLLLWWFGQIPLSSILANAVAIPVVGFLIVPLVLLGSLCLLILPKAGVFLLNEALWLIDGLMWWLNFCFTLPLALWSQATPPVWAILLACVGVLLLLLPWYFPARWLGVFWFLPALLYVPTKPEHGEFRFTLLDVDQGLSAVIQTRQHVLLYDTGTAFFGKAVVVPYLYHQGIHTLDTMLISHKDWDHIGGSQTVLQQLTVQQIISNVPKRFPQHQDRLVSCLRGQSWQWDGVLFEILHPTSSNLQNGNDSSCVLKISTPHNSVLLTGDIEKRAEVELYLKQGEKLPADVLVVPHHGSRTSSLNVFIKKINPQYALLPVGYLNRYQQPHPQIVQRYQQYGIQLLSSAQAGAIEFYFGKNGLSEPQTARKKYQRYWRYHRALIR